MFKSKLKEFSLPLILVLAPNVLFFLFGLFYIIPRPIIVYDYFLLFILFYFNCSSFLIWSSFVAILLIDLLSITSSIYLFTVDSFIQNLRFIGNYEFKVSQFVLLVILLISLIYIYRIIKTYRKSSYTHKSYAYFILTALSIFFLLDTLNGSSPIEVKKYQGTLSKYNLAGSLILSYYHNFENILIADENSQPRKLQSESITFKTFKGDNRGSQLLVVVESFGLIQDTTVYKSFFSSIVSEFQKNNWKCAVGSTPFKGSTTSSELRELLNLSGDYRFFLNNKKSKNYRSIFDLKLNHGYQTIGVHSYRGQMFERDLWWKNIGIRSSYFMEDILLNKNYRLQLNYETPFTSCQDEDAFDFIQSKVGIQKVFGYLLCENSHLPFNGDFKNQEVSGYFRKSPNSLSNECINQLIRIKKFLGYVAKNLDKTKWNKVLIVGDHMPPYVRKTDRDFYSDEQVPYLLIEQL
jgi:hypothetical protein